MLGIITRRRLFLAVALVGLIAVACGSAQSSPASSGATPTSESPTQAPTPFGPSVQTPSPDPDPTPTPTPGSLGLTVVDTSIASVPLDQIVFDDLDTGLLFRLTDATDEAILQLRDRIPPLNNPEYVKADEVDYLDPDDLVLGYSAGGEHYAYPFQLLNFHEFVNDELDGIPVLVSYCPLCRSGVVFDRRVDGQTLSFGNTNALYENNAVAYDRETGSYWLQAAGEAIVGPLTGRRMRPLPSVTTTWEEWKSLHPDTRVLSINTGYLAPYDIDYFAGYENLVNASRFSFP
ncbi:MAG: DUF3179 domain-containing (seleno)protein, partial [Dehalococcoidia bacterium]